jgi:hypothetical protein
VSMFGCATLPVQYVVCRFRRVIKHCCNYRSIRSSAAQLGFCYCNQPKTTTCKLLSLAQTLDPAKCLLVAVQSVRHNRQTAAHDEYTIECLYHHLLLCNKQAAQQEPKLRPTCCTGLLPLIEGDSQWPIKGPAAALLGMLQLRVVEPVRAKATLCTVFPPAAFLPTSDSPGARKDFFRRLQKPKGGVSVQKQVAVIPGW